MMSTALLSAITLRPVKHETGDRLVALVGCGKAKSVGAAPVRELYTSPLFKKSIELAELVAGAGNVFVASAAHGLLELDARISPYDETLVGKPLERRRAWAKDVVDTIARRTLGTGTRLRLVLFMGSTYADPIIADVEKRRASSTSWSPCVDVLRGLEIGQRLALLNRALPLARGAS